MFFRSTCIFILLAGLVLNLFPLSRMGVVHQAYGAPYSHHIPLVGDSYTHSSGSHALDIRHKWLDDFVLKVADTCSAHLATCCSSCFLCTLMLQEKAGYRRTLTVQLLKYGFFSTQLKGIYLSVLSPPPWAG